MDTLWTLDSRNVVLKMISIYHCPLFCYFLKLPRITVTFVEVNLRKLPKCSRVILWYKFQKQCVLFLYGNHSDMSKLKPDSAETLPLGTPLPELQKSHGYAGITREQGLQNG